METTPRLRKALTYAKESVSRFGHPHMSSAHLILGLLSLGEGVAPDVLRKAGLSVQSVENYLSSRRLTLEDTAIRDGVSVGRSVLLAFERAEDEARREHTYLGVEHMLLGILGEESGEAAALFASVHIDQQRLRQIIEEELRQ